MRGEAGLMHFEQSVGSASLDERAHHRASKAKNIRNIKVTGFEGQYANLPKKEHMFEYPNELHIYSFESGWWLLDGGSVAPVLALGLTGEEEVLDMCAAPGGKSLLIVQTDLMGRILHFKMLFVFFLLEKDRIPLAAHIPIAGRLTCNDNKQSRLGQLHRALGQYIPTNTDVADRVILKRKDASVLDTWDECSQYDKVLVDVPCTSDRLSVNRDDGNLYSTQLTEQRLNLPQVQTRMLVNALRSVRVGGCVVYSTCALSPVQNEAVVENGVAIAEEHFGISVRFYMCISFDAFCAA
ncbi:unnamed protein product [Gongylonema pulchrum]|uniref:NOL1/NOP2/Sun domain family member 4 n=1 Tax=Gongylonema pulchrum TaxID=637853 RepID=A0A183E0D3_9BILA|nr:unnamed protein product [Gongylonema pulchrum]